MASKILIVEDEVHIRRILQLKLSGAGFEIAVAMDAASGLELAKEFHPDLIVTDYRMPGGLDGVDLIKGVRGTAGISETPMILLTGSVAVLNDLDGQLRDVPNVTLLSKPFSPRALLQRIIEILAGD